jgi:germination protein YpeB
MIKVTKRGMVRILAFSLAIITALSIKAFAEDAEAASAKRALENSYMRSIGELARSLENIKNTLNKGMYSNSPLMMSELSSRLAADASAAKASLSGLPLSETNLINTYKFLSQAGNYSKALSRRSALGEELSLEDRENLAALHEFASVLAENIWSVESQLRDGFLSFDKVDRIARELDDAAALAGAPAHVTDGFSETEDTFDDYPMLIYDGPFSDHIMQKEPLMTMNTPDVGIVEAAEIAARLSGKMNLSYKFDEGGRLPSYVFGSGNTSVAITKSGGFLSYMLDYRTVDAERITVEQATAAARRFLERIGIIAVTETYHETRDGVCIINFAAYRDGVTLYTDLIKVGVALDTGEVLSVDARGWLVNHNPDRELGAPLLSQDEAMALLSPFLTVESVKLSLIPSDGMNEVFCYEFRCRTGNGQQILIYINADTGTEEQIFLLKISNNGILTV